MIIHNHGYEVNIKTSDIRHFHTKAQNKESNIEESFGEALLKIFDDINKKETKAKELQELAVVSPEEVNVHEVIIAEEEARISLLFVKTVVEKGISAWRDLLNLR
ncbi:MAG: flagellar hook-basal body complex protein FliE [Brevinematales bacterium]|nr:flagellar hook-basal body complex protein FliE [Brevinematales bacterium]